MEMPTADTKPTRGRSRARKSRRARLEHATKAAFQSPPPRTPRRVTFVEEPTLLAVIDRTNKDRVWQRRLANTNKVIEDTSVRWGLEAEHRQMLMVLNELRCIAKMRDTCVQLGAVLLVGDRT